MLGKAWELSGPPRPRAVGLEAIRVRQGRAAQAMEFQAMDLLDTGGDDEQAGRFGRRALAVISS